jgi:hypothetical protein
VVAEYVGVDLHRRRSVIVRLDQAGEVISEVRVGNDPMVLAAEIGKAGSDARVVLEATYGWYWAVDLIQAMGFDVHLAHPLGLTWGKRRRKDDRIDARDLADLLRLGRSSNRPGRCRLAGVVDRPAGCPGAAGVGPLSVEAGLATDLV